MQTTIFSILIQYGVDLVRFTHHNDAVICASKNGWDESLRYLSLHDNRYLRYFKGHRDRVVSLAMSPRDDTFISGSLDNTIRIWDLNSNSCQVPTLYTLCALYYSYFTLSTLFTLRSLYTPIYSTTLLSALYNLRFALYTLQIVT